MSPTLELNSPLTCHCEEPNSAQFAGYFSNEELLGFFCQSCFKEWLLEEYVEASDEGSVTVYDKKFLSPKRNADDSIPEPAKAARKEIKKDDLSDSLKPGAHVMWYHMCFWHHAIVLSESENNVSLIHISKSTETSESEEFKVVQENVDVFKDWDSVYVVEYDDQVKRYNPAELVIARAKATIGMNGYHILKNNCENFAAFLKSGISTHQQRDWFVNKAKDILHQLWKKANFKFVSPVLSTCAAEILQMEAKDQYIPRSAESIGTGLIVAYEGGMCMWNMNKLYQRTSEESKTKDKKISRKEFVQKMVKAVSKSFFFGGENGRHQNGDNLAVTAIGEVLCPGLGTVSGAVLGIVGGCVGLAITHILGVNVGKIGLNSNISNIKTNTKVVSFDDVEPGDHIIMYETMTHFNCHGIVIRVHKQKQLLIIIRHSIEHGVILDSLYYSGYDPLYKVNYEETALHSAEEIITRATQVLVENDRHDMPVRRNSKQFAYSITLKG